MWALLLKWGGSGGWLLSLGGGGRCGAAHGLLLLMGGCLSADRLLIHNTTTSHIFPLSMDGIVAFVETRAPTDKEIFNLPHVHITSDVLWHPKNASYRLQQMEDGHVKVQRNACFAETYKEATESSSLIPSVANCQPWHFWFSQSRPLVFP